MRLRVTGSERALSAGERNFKPMPKRRADDGRRFFDEFASVRVSRLRATGVVWHRTCPAR
jgi:hypothetical protein